MDILEEIFMYIFGRINTKSISMLTVLIVVIFGIRMVFKEINSDGSIDIKSTFISGQIKSGSVGLCLIFLGIVLAIVCNIIQPKSFIEVQNSDIRISYKGAIPPESMKGMLKSLIDSISQKKESD